MSRSESVYVRQMALFSALLRQEGLAVGLRETEDACSVLQALDLTDRSAVRDALCAVFAKSHQEQLTFYKAFDGFFVSAEARQAMLERKRQEAEELARRRAEAEQELQFNGRSIELDKELEDVYVQMPEEKREQLRRILERTEENTERSPDLYNNFIRSVFKRFLLEQQMVLEDAALNVEEKDPDLALLCRDISQFRDEDIPRAAELIARIARQLNADLSRRKRTGGHNGVLDFKRTIRQGVQSGGSFHRLSFRRKRKHRRQLVMLCDVSGSMLQFSEFVLRFIQSIASISESSRTFLFSEKMCQVDAFALQDMDLFRKQVRASGIYGRGTDLGSALETLCQIRPAALTPSTTLLIVSDTKTIGLERTVAALQEAKRLAGKVLWLNPIPERKWAHISSVQAFSQLCAMAPCSTLDELSDACRRLLRM